MEMMEQETLKFDVNYMESPRSVLKSDIVISSAVKESDFSCKDSRVVPDPESGEIDQIEVERSLIEFIRHDDSGSLVSLLQQLSNKASGNADTKKGEDRSHQETLDRSIASRLLHLACKLDSVECATALLDAECALKGRVNALDGNGRTPLHNAAQMHSVRCIEVLLQKSARTDFRSKDKDALLPLEVALSSKRLEVMWTINETVEELLVLLSERDLSTVRLLMERTREVPEVAYVNALEGRVVVLAVLLMVDADKVNGPMMLPRKMNLGPKLETTIYECVVKEAIALGQLEEEEEMYSSCEVNSDSFLSINNKRIAMLYEIELLQLFGAAARRSSSDKRMASPLISACQAGDEPVVKMLLKTKIDVDATDKDGNSALHWCLRSSPCSKDSSFRLVCLLLRHGARVSQKNRLGLTPLHVAAENGNFQALQILLFRDPKCVDISSETEETPLFFAVKSNSVDCAQLLLAYGANTKFFNLRRERPVDLAKSQDMRFILSPTNLSFWNRAVHIKEISFSLPNHDGSNAEKCEEFLNKKDAITPERQYTHVKTELCRYYESPSGCVRGAECYFAHGEEELRRNKSGSVELNLGSPSHPVARNLSKARVTKDLNRKVFIGGLPHFVSSDDLRDYFEREFGAVEDSILIRSQAGDHVHSRGFGFVTFKDEESVAAAVQAHHINILGKKVEIIKAVPKSALLQESPKQFRQQQQQQEHQKLLNSSQNELAADGKPDTSLPLGGLQTTNLDTQVGQQTGLPPWVETFKRWFPSFLAEVSKRLGHGEYYPLSSLKGDFRATCGMELDHASLGYPKLSDFVRSFSGTCRMKIVPVGKGNATHMVLLPPTSCCQNQLNPPMQSPIKDFYVPYKSQHVYDDMPLTSVGIAENLFAWPLQLHTPGNEKKIELHESLSSWTFCCVDSGGASEAGGPKGLGLSESFSLSHVNPKFLSSLQPGLSFFTPWYILSPDVIKCQWKQPQASAAEPFSYFARQFDYYKNLQEGKESSVDLSDNDHLSGRQCYARNGSICLVCNERKALWALLPCRHKVLCQSCKLVCRRTQNDSLRICQQCGESVQGFLFAPWDDIRKVTAEGTDGHHGQNHLSDSSPQSNELRPGFPPLSHQESTEVTESPVITVPAFQSSKLSKSPGKASSCSLCLVCRKVKATWAHVPCGHKVLCSNCKSGHGKLSLCMVCHAPVHSTIALCD